MPAFEAEAVTKDSLKTDFEALASQATARRGSIGQSQAPQFAVAPQDLVILFGSIAENIRVVRR